MTYPKISKFESSFNQRNSLISRARMYSKLRGKAVLTFLQLEQSGWSNFIELANPWSGFLSVLKMKRKSINGNCRSVGVAGLFLRLILSNAHLSLSLSHTHTHTFTHTNIQIQTEKWSKIRNEVDNSFIFLENDQIRFPY